MGRKKKNYLPFNELRNYVKKLGLKSRMDYYRWHDANKPLYAPKQPMRVWPDEWINWNDFLGTSNRFGNEEKLNREKYRPYWEAVRFVHKLKLKTSKQYYEWARGPDRPCDIPDRPDAIYNKDWKGWKAYLGVNVEERLNVLKETENKLIIVLANPKNLPVNAITLIKTKKPFNKIGEDWDHNLTPIAAYYVLPDKVNQFHKLIEQFSTPKWDDPSIVLVSNMGSLLWELDYIVDRIRW